MDIYCFLLVILFLCFILKKDNIEGLEEPSFETMMQKGMCIGEPNSRFHHSCKIEDPLETRPKIDMRYVNLPPSELNPSSDYTYLSICPETYKQNMDILNEKESMGQYAGYSNNSYIDRTRYVKSDEPLPVNPDFFMDGGGTYA